MGRCWAGTCSLRVLGSAGVKCLLVLRRQQCLPNFRALDGVRSSLPDCYHLITLLLILPA